MEIAAADNRLEQMQLAIKDATRKIIGEFHNSRPVSAHSFLFSDVSTASAEIGESADTIDTEGRLKALKDAAEDIANIGMKCFWHLAPRENYEGTFTQFLR